MADPLTPQNLNDFDLHEDSDNDENYIDANETLPAISETDLLSSLKMARTSFFQFLNDEPDKVRTKLEPLWDKSVYHALCYAAVVGAHAAFSFGQAEIESALETVTECSKVIIRRRRKNTLTNNVVTKMVIRPDYNTYTEEEVHAELCYAESLVMRAMLAFVQEGNLLSYVRGGLRLRRAYQVYKECQEILDYRTWDDEELREQFESGVDMGLGTFNLVISAVPPRFLRLLQFIGFSGDREFAIERLTSGHKKFHTMRGSLCTIALLVYTSVARFMLGYPKVDGNLIHYCETLLEPFIKDSPKGPVTLYFEGRLEHIRGNIPGAIDKLEPIVRQKFSLEKSQHIAVFELAWICMALGKWRKVASNLDIMCREAPWSKTVCFYLKGCSLAMCKDRTDEEQKELIHCMTETPKYVQTFFGRTVPVEKYCKKRAERFFAQGNWLPLPMFEMMYAANYFYLLKGQNDILEPILEEVERSLVELQGDQHKDCPWQVDNYCLAVFLKGLTLYYMGYPLSAEEYFLEVVQNFNQKNIVQDVHVASFALMELGYICMETGNHEQAVEYLSEASATSIFITEFRIHQGLKDLQHKGYSYDRTCKRDDYD